MIWRFPTIDYSKCLLIENDEKELCELADVSPSTISKMGRGEIVSMEVIARICLKLNCTVDDILEILPDSPDYGTDEKIK